jgi:hypothetical protein
LVDTDDTKTFGVIDWTLHDLRRTARSLMSRAGVPSNQCVGPLPAAPVSPVSKTSATSATDVLAVGFFLQRQVRLARSTHRVTSPFPGSVRPEALHVYPTADFPDVYAGTPLVNRPYDAILDVFLALPPMPAELHALRLRLAFSGRRSPMLHLTR